MTEFINLKKKELLALPKRHWDKTTEYDSLLLVPNGKHDSGYALIAIVGVNQRTPVEIAAYCDDIVWGFPTEHPYDSVYLPRCGYHAHVMRTDCLPSGIIHIWASSENTFSGRFRVGSSLSSTEVELFVHKHGVTQALLEAARKALRLESLLT